MIEREEERDDLKLCQCLLLSSSLVVLTDDDVQTAPFNVIN